MAKPRGPRPLRPFEQAYVQLRQHYLLGAVARALEVRAPRLSEPTWPPAALCRLQGAATVVVNADAKLTPSQWLAVLAVATLMLALGAPRHLAVPSPISDRAAQLAALHWWRMLRVGELPERLEVAPEHLQWGRLPLRDIAARLEAEPEHELHAARWSLGGDAREPVLVPGPLAQGWHAGAAPIDLEQVFAQAMVDNARRALQVHHDAGVAPRDGTNPHGNGARAKRWLIAHYPLLGGLLTQFELVECAQVCRRLDIAIAAIHVGAGEIYLNPARGLSLEQSKFVVAHEVLHAGLCHASRRNGRDPYLWNVACDFVINDWLVTMQVGTPPPDGPLFDEALRGWSADDIYLRLAADLRVRRRLRTLRGDDCDLLDDRLAREFTDREEFCRRALAQGLDHHQSGGRGLLPAGLVEAIRTLAQPPIPWQARLAQWMRERFPLAHRLRTYARPSRRQSSTPDIPRPRLVAPQHERATRTFGVVVDSSGSMQRMELGKALGAIVSYAQAQEVREVRLVFCDAQPYDEGFVPVESLAARVAVRGRGGTVLQPAVDLLQTRRDFPKDAPILLITDGACECDLQVAREHAFLLSTGGRLPFVTRAPVFRMT